MGRRVGLLAVLSSSSDEDRNGVVRGYDERTGFYHVELDSGVVRTSRGSCAWKVPMDE